MPRPCSPNYFQPLSGQTACLPLPAEGVDRTVQDRLALLPGWYSGSANATALDAGQYELALTVAGSVDAFDSAAFEASLRTYLQCAEPACTVGVHVAAASVRVTAAVTDTAEASVSAAARLTHMTADEVEAAPLAKRWRLRRDAPL